jgi:hypothetical protein
MPVALEKNRVGLRMISTRKITPQRLDCLAGVVGLELRNPYASYVFEMS